MIGLTFLMYVNKAAYKQLYWLQKFQYFSERIVQVKLGNYLTEKKNDRFFKTNKSSVQPRR